MNGDPLTGNYCLGGLIVFLIMSAPFWIALVKYVWWGDE